MKENAKRNRLTRPKRGKQEKPAQGANILAAEPSIGLVVEGVV
jgi:hypothetical protein